MKTLIVILGPTAVGKTSTSIKIAQHFNTEIISADSRQIFSELTIGTAAPTTEELQAVKHHFIKTQSIHDYYSASLYEQQAIQKIEELHQNRDTVVLTGGSMMYIDAVCNGIDEIPDVDPTIREKAIHEFEEFGLEYIQEELQKVDPQYFDKVDQANAKRILHALEVYRTTGKPFSSFHTQQVKKRNFNIVKIGLNYERAFLYERINQRVDLMMQEGLEQEAKSVYPHRKLNSLNTVGYKELFSYFDGDISLEKAIELIKRNSRRYAKKQLTWFRRDEAIEWFEPNNTDQIIQYIKLQNQE